MQLKQFLDEAEYVVVLTGAGVSVPSGIPDFRSNKGLYQSTFQNLPPEIILSSWFYHTYPERFFEFYKHKMLFLQAKPNIIHQTLAILEDWGKVKAIITQNIDGLHQAAGSKNVVELHGSVHRNYCERCHRPYAAADILHLPGVPQCQSCGGIIKPDVTLYNEMLNRECINRARQHVAKADLLIVIGTSLLVRSASDLLLELSHGK